MSKYSKRIKSGKSTGTSTLRELKIAMKKHGQDLTGFKSGGMAKGSREGSVIKAKKGTHVTKDGRTAKKGLYYNMNKRRKAGTSRPGKGTVSAKALKRFWEYFGGMFGRFVGRFCVLGAFFVGDVQRFLGSFREGFERSQNL